MLAARAAVTPAAGTVPVLPPAPFYQQVTNLQFILQTSVESELTKDTVQGNHTVPRGRNAMLREHVLWGTQVI